MFREYIQSLSEQEMKEFLTATKMSPETLRNAYMPKEPLKRGVPRPERLASIIMACDGKLHALTILEYFVFQPVFEILKLEDDPKLHLRAKSSILNYE